MPTIRDDTAIVLRSVKHGETSLILTVFARAAGKIGIMAKGARSKAKMGATAGLQLLSEVQLVYYDKPGRDLHLLKEWNIVSVHAELHTDLRLLAVGSALAELLAKCTRDEDPHPDLYDEAAATLNRLNDAPASPLALLWAFELRLFQAFGFALQFERCAATDQSFAPPLRGNVRCRLTDGSFLHPDAPSSIKFDLELSGRAFAILAKLAGENRVLAGKIITDATAEREIGKFLTRFLETHLPVRGALRSLNALHWNDSTNNPLSS
jgi:DNA repair protein RecO